MNVHEWFSDRLRNAARDVLTDTNIHVSLAVRSFLIAMTFVAVVLIANFLFS